MSAYGVSPCVASTDPDPPQAGPMAYSAKGMKDHEGSWPLDLTEMVDLTEVVRWVSVDCWAGLAGPFEVGCAPLRAL